MVTLTATLGIPGSGKSTWARQHAASTGAMLLTADAIRGGASPVQTFNAMLIQAEEALSSGASVVIDACNTNAGQRRRWLKLAWRLRAQPQLHIVDTPAAICLARNAERHQGDRVPDDRMQAYVADWPDVVRTALGEGWAVTGRPAQAPTSGASRQW